MLAWLEVMLAVVAIGVSYRLSTRQAGQTGQATKELSYSQQARYRKVRVADGAFRDTHVVSILVRNSGNVHIERSDYDAPIGFSFGVGAQIIGVEVADQTPHDLGVDPKTRDQQAVEIVPILLNPGDNFIVEVHLTSFPSGLVTPFGRIRGIPAFKNIASSHGPETTAQPSGVPAGAWITLGIICAVVALLFVPIFFGGLGILFGYLARRAGSMTGGMATIVISNVCLILGVLFGLMVAFA